MDTKKEDGRDSHDRLKPLSLYPLSEEEALSEFMKADPLKVESRLREEGVKKDKK